MRSTPTTTRPRATNGPRHISDILPEAIRSIRPGDPKLEAIATALEQNGDPVEALREMGRLEAAA